MFLDSKIASKMELRKGKLKYIVNYGITPFFAEELKKQVNDPEWIAVCYDESLNKFIQESKMSLVLRFWNTFKNEVQVRYWDSIFLGHTTAADLLQKINNGLADFYLSKQIQLSMDEPDMKKEREKAGFNNLVNIGSCNLLIVHRPLKSATEATKSNLQTIMKGSF